MTWTVAQKLAALGKTPDNVAYEAVTNPRVLAVLDVLAPDGVPVFEWGHETTPSPAELILLAEQIVAAIDQVPTVEP